jgi:hypothetical protein
MKPTIEIIIGTEGEVTIEAHNFKGASCEKATKFLEEALGMSGKKNRKPEFFQQETAKQSQRT